MDKQPIEIGRERRPMECELTEAECKIRSDQVHSQLEIRSQKEAERDKLEAQAKATKEMGKAKDEEIKELDLKIKELSTAVRTKRATVDVEILSLYDPVTGEIQEKRADTGLVTPLGRKPTAEEWDEIKRIQQLVIDQVKDGRTELTSLADQTTYNAARALGAEHKRKGRNACTEEVLGALGVGEVSEAQRELLIETYLIGYKEAKVPEKTTTPAPG